MFIFKFKVLGILFVSFRSILFHSHSCYAGDFLLISHQELSADFELSFDCSGPHQTTKISELSFPFFPHSLVSRSFRCVSPLYSRFRYSACCDSFHRILTCFTAATSATSQTYVLGILTMACALGQGYSATGIVSH